MQLGTKECNKCQQHKPLDQFGSANGGKSKQPSCRDCMKENRAKWGKDNPDRIRNYDDDRRTKIQRRAYTHDDKIRFWNLRSHICLCCAKPILSDNLNTAQLDHIIPLVKGGTDTDENLALAHKRCNTDKHNKTLEAHWLWRFNQKLDAVKLSWFELDNIIVAARYRE